MIKEQDMETTKTWKIFILTHSSLFWNKPFFWPMPKFGSTLTLWTHATHTKILNHVTHAIFLAHAKILWTHGTHAKNSTHATHANFLAHAKILQTHATNAKFWPMPPMHPCYPRHPHYLADSLNYNFSQTTLPITNFAVFSLKIFQQKTVIFTKCNFFGQTLFSCHWRNQIFTYHIYIFSSIDIRNN